MSTPPCWFALGALGLGCAKPGARSAQHVEARDRRDGHRLRAQLCRQARRRRPRPQLEDCRRSRRWSHAVVPERPRDDLVRGGGDVQPRAAAAAPLLYGAATMFAVSRPYLGVHYPSDVLAGARSAPRPGGCCDADEGRDRRHAQRRQVLAVQRADRRRRRGGQLPVHDDRAERRGGPGRGRAHERRSPRPSRHRRSSGTRSPSTTSRGWSPAPTRARVSATSSWPTFAKPTRCCTSSAPTPTAASSTPRAGSTRCATSRRSRPS